MNNKRKMNQFGGFMPMFQNMMPMPPMPPMPFMPNYFGMDWSEARNGVKNVDEWMDGCESNFLTVWEQMIDMNKTSIETSRDQWEQFFDHIMDMEDTFIESLPDELPTMPGFPPIHVSPKDFMERVKKFQLSSKVHFMEQADSCADYHVERQEQIRDMVKSVTEKVSEQRKEFAEERAAAASAEAEATVEVAAKEEGPKEKATKTEAPKEKAAKADSSKGDAKNKI